MRVMITGNTGYAGKGGIRVEDIVVVEVGGCCNLTAYPKFLEV